jgi:hypothetical protein
VSRSRLTAALATLLAVVALAGCYGSTEPATDVKLDGATLNAYGSTEDARTIAYFLYWTGSRSNGTGKTPTRYLPAGARGPFREPVTGLSPDTEYSFQLCGQPEGRDGQSFCAQVRTFRTQPGDEVTAELRYGDAGARLHALSGPHGEGARGFLAFEGNADPPDVDDVVCLSVHGSEAVVGTRSSPSSTSGVLYGLRAGIGQVSSAPGRDPTTCASYRPADLPARDIDSNATIHDAP